MELDCESCLLPFDQTLRRPKVLPCGHTCCLACLNMRWGEGDITCTQDNQVVRNDPNDLPNNMFILASLSSVSRDRPNRNVVDDEPEVVKLEELATLLQEKVDALRILETELLEATKVHEDERRKQQQDMQACVEHLKNPDWEQHVDEAAQLLDKHLPLLMEPELTATSLSIRTAGPPSEKDDTWDSVELRLPDQPALRLALHMLNQQGHLKHKHVEMGRKWAAPAGEKQQNYHQDCDVPVEIDVINESTETGQWEPVRKYNVFVNYPVVNVLRNLECSVDEAWSLTLLKMHKRNLTHVELMHPKPQHLLAVDMEEMPELRRLMVVFRESSDDSVPAPTFERPRFKSSSQGLYWLHSDGLPLKTFRSLLKTHSPTLQVLQVVVGTPPAEGTESRWPVNCYNLVDVIREAKLESLASVLLFQTAPHDQERCGGQLEAIRKVVKSTCTVDCDWCNNDGYKDQGPFRFF